MLQRLFLGKLVDRKIRENPVTALLGPRQCGKTTVAREIGYRRRGDYFDLEDPVSLQRLSEPMTALRPLRGLVVIDEVQRRPELFPILRVLADRRPLPARFLVLGSASPDLLQQSSETLAGRIAFIEMGGFDTVEAGPGSQRRLWWRGGFPRAFLARVDAQARSWQLDFIRTFLERDIRELGSQVPAANLRRLWSMVAHYHGQIWNSGEISRSLGEGHATVKRHLDLLTGALVVRQLPAWHENLDKRQVKAPKVYLRDSGILHALLGIPSLGALEGHHKLGASWEGFVIEEIIRVAGERNAYFWATHAGGELDLLLTLGGKRYGVEVKYKDAPGTTKSMRVAMRDLRLDRLLVVYPGESAYPLDTNIDVMPLNNALDILRRIAKKAAPLSAAS